MILSRDTEKVEEEAVLEEPIVEEEPGIKGNDGLIDDYDLYGDDLLGEGGHPPMQRHSDLLKSLTDFNPYIKEAINNWIGMTWDEEKKEYIENLTVNKIMNMNGAIWCAGLMKTYARGNNIITDISIDEYKNILADHIEVIWLNLGTRDDLGIMEDGDLLRVSNELEHSAALVLMGAGDGKYNKFLGTTITRSEQIRPNEDIYRSAIQRGGLSQKGGILRQLKRVLTGK